MCGRVFTKTSAEQLVFAFGVERRQGDMPDQWKARFNGAPGLDYPLIIGQHDMPGRRFQMARWGFIPAWSREDRPKVRPINAMAESVASNGMFRDAFRFRRALMPIDGFFEWKAITGSKAKKPHAVAMADGQPFALAAIYEHRRNRETGLEETTFAVITCPANAMMAEIHSRMPVILDPKDYDRWLSDASDPRDLLKPYPPERMRMWEISTRVNSVANDDPSILDPVPEEDDETLL